MGNPIARASGVDRVDSPDGSGFCCGSPSVQETDEGSTDVLIKGIGVVREGDKMKPHPSDDGGCCVIHTPVLTSFSSTVFINDKACGRLGDDYEGHYITTGDASIIVG